LTAGVEPGMPPRLAIVLALLIEALQAPRITYS
jgi:hypothetical protein